MRKFIHVDMDCFYAAVEMRDNPALADIPIAIGGSTDRRGVISTCNYPARKFGVRSAMATAQALKLCPNLTLLKGRMDVYKEASDQIRAIFLRYTSAIEPLSWDEAYLDVTEATLFNGSATLIAEDIRRTIKQELDLTASAGVAPIKFVAKIASDENKPDGLCVVAPEQLDAFVNKLPLGKIPGVGKVTLQKLNDLGLFYCSDVRKFSMDKMVKRFGKFGLVIWNRAHAIDERGLSVNRKRKSIGVERTLSEDIESKEECDNVLSYLLPKLRERLLKNGKVLNIKSQGVKLKFSDFQQTTVEQKHHELNELLFSELLTEARSRAAGRKIRLVGVHVALADNEPSDQLALPLFAI